MVILGGLNLVRRRDLPLKLRNIRMFAVHAEFQIGRSGTPANVVAVPFTFSLAAFLSSSLLRVKLCVKVFHSSLQFVV